MDKQKVELPIGFLASLNQGLQEEQRFVQQIKVEAKRIDEELDYKYGKLLDSMIKVNFLTATVRTKNFGLLVARNSSRTLSTPICVQLHLLCTDSTF